jgi:hypothetical protein
MITMVWSSRCAQLDTILNMVRPYGHRGMYRLIAVKVLPSVKQRSFSPNQAHAW